VSEITPIGALLEQQAGKGGVALSHGVMQSRPPNLVDHVDYCTPFDKSLCNG
jgi:hypothetical protein